ncbi:hypothetical protein L0F63_006379 [Massospora cicadina]|nr:hypothetical protein L0F63_006379 [Massospora cicadina]
MRLDGVLAALFCSAVCGQLRIVNGTPVRQFKYPWMVAIVRYDRIHCGGTLISQNKIITAAHCMAGAKAPLDTFKVHLHRHNVDLDPKLERSLVYNVIKRWVAPRYDPNSLYNDVAIIAINARGSATTQMQLDTIRDHAAGEIAIALGWGATKQGGRYSAVLREVGLPLIPNSRCATIYRASESAYVLRKNQICTLASKGDKDACQGDSGPTLIGIISSGNRCADIKSPGGILLPLLDQSSSR